MLKKAIVAGAAVGNNNAARIITNKMKRFSSGRR